MGLDRLGGWLDRWTARRREIAGRYRAGLAGLGIGLPAELPHAEDHCRAPVAVPAVGCVGEAHDVGSGLRYPVPIHLQESLVYLTYSTDDCPVSELPAAYAVWLPFFSEKTEAIQAVVFGTIAVFFNNCEELRAGLGSGLRGWRVLIDRRVHPDDPCGAVCVIGQP